MKSRIKPKITVPKKLVGYCIDNSKKDALLSAVLELGIDITFIGTASAGETVGHLVNITGFPKTGAIVADPPECEVLIMSGIKGPAIDRLLAILREKNASIELKCIVTPINQNWQLFRLIEELQKEHTAMHSSSSSGKS